KSLRAKRPQHFFRQGGTMPEQITLTFVIPPELGDPDDVIAKLRELVEGAEHQFKAERTKNGEKLLGRRAVLEQSCVDTPTTERPRRKLRPRFAGKTAVRTAALLAYKEFLASYREARRRWIETG